MKINKIYGLIALMAVVAALSSCDRIDGNYVNYNIKPDTATAAKKVLLEDFTAFRCGNCPAAHIIANGILNQYPGKVIVLAIHSGSLATPYAGKPYYYNFKTPEGDELDNFFNISSIGHPNGLINRETIDGSLVIPPAAWEESVGEVMNEAPKVTIDLAASYNPATRQISGTADIKYLEPGEANLNVCYYIVEDSIVQYQYDDSAPTPDILDYVHNHVLRGSIGGTWGVAISDVPVEAGTVIHKDFNYTIDAAKDWKPEHLKILAFVQDNGKTYKVLQAEEKDLIGSK